MEQHAFRSLSRITANSYRKCGRYAYYFALGKLRLDPVFRTVLGAGLIASGTRVLDLGCGAGLLLSVLVEVEKLHQLRAWPQDWPIAPRDLRLYGIERDARAAQWARTTLAGHATIETADLRHAALPPCDVVVLLDVLHYLKAGEQRSLLEKVAHSLSPDGQILMRVGDATARPSFTLTCDRIGTLLRGQAWPHYHVRPVREWQALLAEIGFESAPQPMIAATPFRNILLRARRRRG